MNPNPASVEVFVSAFTGQSLAQVVGLVPGGISADTLANQAYNQGLTDQSAIDATASGDVTPAQEASDIAAAVASAVAPLNTQISALQLAQSQEQALLASVQTMAQNIVAALTAGPSPAPSAPASS